MTNEPTPYTREEALKEAERREGWAHHYEREAARPRTADANRAHLLNLARMCRRLAASWRLYAEMVGKIEIPSKQCDDGCCDDGEGECEAVRALRWMTHAAYEAPVAFAMTEDGDIGMWRGFIADDDDEALSFSVDNTVEGAILNAMKRAAKETA